MTASCSFTTTDMNEPSDSFSNLRRHTSSTLQESGVNKFLRRRNINSGIKSVQQPEFENSSRNQDDFSEYRRLCEVRIRRLERYKKTKSLISLCSANDNSNNNNFLNYGLEEANKQQVQQNPLQNACSHGNIFYTLSTTNTSEKTTNNPTNNKEAFRDENGNCEHCICCSRNSVFTNNNNYQHTNYLTGIGDSIFVDSENPPFLKHIVPIFTINYGAESCRNSYPINFQSQRRSTDLISSISSSDYTNCSTASDDGHCANSKLESGVIGKSHSDLSSFIARDNLLLRRKSAIDTSVNLQFEMLREKMISLMENDVQLLQQLLTLGETIQELRRDQQKPIAKTAASNKTTSLRKAHSNYSLTSDSSASLEDNEVELEIKKINKLESDDSEAENNELEDEWRPLENDTIKGRTNRSFSITHLYVDNEHSKTLNHETNKHSDEDDDADEDELQPNIQYFSRKNSVLRIPIPPRASNRKFGTKQLSRRSSGKQPTAQFCNETIKTKKSVDSGNSSASNSPLAQCSPSEPKPDATMLICHKSETTTESLITVGSSGYNTYSSSISSDFGTHNWINNNNKDSDLTKPENIPLKNGSGCAISATKATIFSNQVSSASLTGNSSSSNATIMPTNIAVS